MQASQKYIAAFIPRYIRAARLWHLPSDAVIGSKTFYSNGSNMIYDIVMLPDREFMRARFQLGMEHAHKFELSMSSWSPIFIPKYVKEILVPVAEPNSRRQAKKYFREAFGLDEPRESETDDAFTRASQQGNDAHQEEPSHQRQNSNDPYVIFGITKSMSDTEIKRRYRSLIRKYHPDKLSSAGLTPEMMARANEEMKRINAAYETIKKSRSMK